LKNLGTVRRKRKKKGSDVEGPGFGGQPLQGEGKAKERALAGVRWGKCETGGGGPEGEKLRYKISARGSGRTREKKRWKRGWSGGKKRENSALSILAKEKEKIKKQGRKSGEQPSKQSSGNGASKKRKGIAFGRVGHQSQHGVKGKD